MTSTSKIRVGVCNVCYSPNVGDGLLSTCLSEQMKTSSPRVIIVNIDIAGRTRFVDGADKRERAVRVLSNFPRAVRRCCTMLAINSQINLKLRGFYREQLSAVDVVVLGGGNLFIDADMNFPLKIRALLEEIRARKIRWVAYGVGVSHRWSRRGKAAICKALSEWPPLWVGVRDAQSKTNWDTILAGGPVPAAQLCNDPALLASDFFSREHLNCKTDRKVLGLNVMAREELLVHSDRIAPSPEQFLCWWTDMVRAAVTQGFQVHLFTNGSKLDQAYLQFIYRQLPSTLAEHVVLRPRPETPDDLVRIVSGCNVVVGYRLHAHISAFASQVPSVGFRWDKKLESFFRAMRLEGSMVSPCITSIEHTMLKIREAVKVGVNEQSWSTSRAEAKCYIATLTRQLLAIADGADLQVQVPRLINGRQ